MMRTERSADGNLKGKSEWYVSAVEQLLEVIQNLSHARDIETVMALVRSAARNLVGADGATFVLRDDEQCYYADEDAISPLWKGQRFSMNICISGWVMIHACPAVIPDIYQDARIPLNAYKPTFVRSLAMVPIRQLDPVGAIGTYWAKPRQPSDEEVRILQALANATSITMENIDLYSRLQRSLQLRERAVLDNIREGVITFNEDGTVTSFNNASETIFGYQRGEIMDKSLAAFLPAIYRQAISGNHHDRIKMITRKNGETFPAEVSISEFILDEQCCFSAIVRDISERLKTEQRLRDSEERYELAVKGSNDGLWDWHIPTDQLYWSDRFREMLGITSPDFRPSYDEFKNRIHPDDLERITSQLETHTRNQAPYDAEFRMRREDGSYIWVRARGACSADQNGRALRMSGSVSDITARKQAEQALAKALEAAEAASASKSEFINSVSQELRTPLASIMSAIQHITADQGLDAECREQAGQAYRTANGLLNVVDNMISLPMQKSSTRRR